MKIFKIIVGVVGAILFFRILNAGDDALENNLDLQSSVISPLMYVAYIILGLCIVSVLAFVIKGLFSGDIKKTLGSLGGFILIILISYGVSDGTETTLRDGEVLSESASKWVSAGLTAFYILIFLAFAAIIVSSIKKLMTNR